ncbi:MAG: hypothetical protein AUG51_12515 [Acidobacteria bacterium 13_1_20CM_3_53_8]|nr:MAG: hypothetical protein AUG51_12515 [Acidobacteria bacterium 13_1_20CM_3_53_8]
MLAQALRDWLPLVLHYVQPWLSETDIGAGKRWSVEIAKQLEESNFGIICLTRENIESSWILFEAGALAKSLQKSAVVPLLLDLDFREISGPLSQFQAKKLDKNSIHEIVQAINDTAESPIEKPRLSQLFEALWPQLESQLISIPESEDERGPVRSPQDILEDLVATIRGMDQRLRSIEQSLPIAQIVDAPKPEPTALNKVVEREARSLLKRGQKINAIALVRATTNLGLREAKDLVETWEGDSNVSASA